LISRFDFDQPLLAYCRTRFDWRILPTDHDLKSYGILAFVPPHVVCLGSSDQHEAPRHNSNKYSVSLAV
jgi:hypothetical protein